MSAWGLGANLPIVSQDLLCIVMAIANLVQIWGGGGGGGGSWNGIRSVMVIANLVQVLGGGGGGGGGSLPLPTP